MVFKREYSVPDANNLYVKVLVKCTNCGMKDVVTDKYEIESVDDTFHSTTDISAHGPCPICEAQEWTEHMEQLKLGLPEQLTPKDYTVLSLSEMIAETTAFEEKLEVAQQEGFVVTEVLDQEGTVVLSKQ